ncbi:molybdopterin-guanine dinucleotide biosynthesis protein B [Sporosarcina sp. PTS2304]|uniref:molybdopterin-guanine dinucleotide biosynthesis protein B n=1 Tax=Sporosarcina sp. PTS2304 TaxID=2283194 RepID=UPI000E0D1B14|nr:molybdopterin-guanine dinucleotide biosynthesis protein B [Sporosarcina sp. PTS2304]AXI01009.1 molybdopterin-guanine dinucleotide biosynthesis protein B [Sporosarcina sp. PTS2304]
MKTLHVVGYKNSGKTTLITHWITLLQEWGFEVAVLKHHGHGGLPELPPAHTDTMQFLAAGAVSTVVAGGGMIQLMQQKERSFQELKALAASNRPDVLLIEGYKQEIGEKIVLIRNEEDREQLQTLRGVLHVARTETLFSDNTALDDWLWRWMEEVI